MAEEELKLSKDDVVHILEVFSQLVGRLDAAKLLFSNGQVKTLNKLGKFLTPPEEMYVALEEFSTRKHGKIH